MPTNDLVCSPLVREGLFWYGECTSVAWDAIIEFEWFVGEVLSVVVTLGV